MQKTSSNKTVKSSKKSSDSAPTEGAKTPYFLPKYGKTYHAGSLQEAVELAEKENK